MHSFDYHHCSVVASAEHPTPERCKSERTAAKKARKRLSPEANETSYWARLRRKITERNRVREWLVSDRVVWPSKECNHYCKKDWAKTLTCSHNVKPSKDCDKTCLSKFRRYKLCRHVALTCQFCDMIVSETRWTCECFKPTDDDDDESDTELNDDRNDTTRYVAVKL